MQRLTPLFILIGLLAWASWGIAGEDFVLDIPQHAIRLQRPVEVESADMFLDGGTIAVVLKDAAGQNFSFCLDGRMRATPWWQAVLKMSPAPRAIYVLARHPSESTAVQ